MRWILLFVVALNLFFYVHHQQQKHVAELGEKAPESSSEIRLLSELRQDRAALVTPAERVCGRLGGFEDRSLAAALGDRLSGWSIEASLESTDAAAGTDHWVYLAPLVSRQAALRQLREIQARNIDSYIITVGDLANGVSLGIFARREAAQDLQRQLGELGYSAEIRELPRSHRLYWLAMDAPSWSQLRVAMLEKLASEFPKMQIQEKSCARIASPE